MTLEEFTPAEPYGSLLDLRRANDELLKSQSGTTSSAPSAAGISNFIDRAAATGTILDAAADRKAAQGLIDYWVASSYSLPRSRNVDLPSLRKANVLLFDFDEDVVATAVAAGEAFVQRLQSAGEFRFGFLNIKTDLLSRFFQDDYDLACQILLRLVQLPGESGGCVSVPAPFQKLAELGDHERVKEIVAGLMDAGVLAVRNDGDVVALKYEALIRKWPWFSLLIDERDYYRKRAINWDQSQKKIRALLEWGLTRKFRKYHDIDDVEKRYIKASYWHAARQLASAGVFVGVVAAGIYVGYNYQALFSKYYVTEARVRSKIDLILNENTSPGAKAAAGRWLASYKKTIKVPTADLRDLDLSDVTAQDSNFESARLERVHFNRSNLRGSSFRKSKLFDVEFVNSELAGVGFDNATAIAGTKFNGASLVRSVFDGVRFCEGVDFTDADVRAASFKNITFSPTQLPIFEGTAWWLMDGLTFEQRGVLGENVPRNKRRLLRSLSKELEESGALAKGMGGNKFTQALWLNQRAWTLAEYGVESPVNDTPDKDMDAAELAKQSIEVLQALIKEGNTNRDYSVIFANVSDTLAYILLQKAAQITGKDDKDKRLAEAVKYFGDAVNEDNDGSVSFRYAVALNATGKVSEALRYLTVSIRDKEYSPTHELYLLDKLFTSDFRTQLRLLTDDLPSRTKPRIANNLPPRDKAQMEHQSTSSDADPCQKRSQPRKGQ
jgi:hypothetical protein